MAPRTRRPPARPEVSPTTSPRHAAGRYSTIMLGPALLRPSIYVTGASRSCRNSRRLHRGLRAGRPRRGGRLVSRQATANERSRVGQMTSRDDSRLTNAGRAARLIEPMGFVPALLLFGPVWAPTSPIGSECVMSPRGGTCAGIAPHDGLGCGCQMGLQPIRADCSSWSGRLTVMNASPQGTRGRSVGYCSATGGGGAYGPKRETFGSQT
jgi:hypothetical protein